MTFGGDGTFSAVDPDNSDIAYESTPAERHPEDHGRREDVERRRSAGGHLPVRQPVRDGPGRREPPAHGRHAGARDDRRRGELDDGLRPRHAHAAGRSGRRGRARGPGQRDLRDRRARRRHAAAGRRHRDAGLQLRRRPDGAGRGHGPPGTYVDRPFTIAANEADRSATITVSWTATTDDWDLVVFRKQGAVLTEVGSSAQGPADHEREGRARPPAGRRLRHPRAQLRGGGDLHGHRCVRGRRGERHRRRRQRGLCRVLRLLRRAQHEAVRQRARDQRPSRRQHRAPRRGRQLAHRHAGRAAPALHHLGRNGPDRRAHGLRDARRLQPPLAAAGRARARRGRRRRQRARVQVHRCGRDVHGHLGEPARHPGGRLAGPQRAARRRHRPRRLHLVRHERRDLRAARRGTARRRRCSRSSSSPRPARSSRTC